LNKTGSFYDYENDFIKIWGKMGREIFEKNLGELLAKGKKTLTVFGEVRICKKHPYSESVNEFQISPRMQQIMAYCGQLDIYEKSSEVLQEMLQIDISETQIFRVTDFYGKAVEPQVNAEAIFRKLKKMRSCLQKWMVL
jgi:hypothetical protein